MKKNYFLYIIYILFLGSIFFAFPKNVYALENSSLKENKNTYNIVVDLNEHELYLVNRDTKKIEKTYHIAGGKPSTPSPIGTWTIIDKEAGWGGGFGTRWMMLNVPWGKYGIHGTNKPLSVGGAISLGCIRMLNKDVEELYSKVGIGTTVVIYGGPYGLFTNEFRTLSPGDRGADVYEVQRRLNERGYYTGKLDGIYGEDMKKDVIKFRIDNKLNITHFIDKEFYNALGINPFE